MRRAYCAMYSGEERYILRPSTRIGKPALGMALIGLEETASIRSMVSRVAFGPTEQFRPITSTGHESISRVKVSVSAPPGRWEVGLVLEFLGLDERSQYSESDLETAIIGQIERFLLEMGKGFLFEARQRRFTFD